MIIKIVDVGIEYANTVLVDSNHGGVLIVVILSNSLFHRGIITFSVVDVSFVTTTIGARVNRGNFGKTFCTCFPFITLCCWPKNVFVAVVRKHPGFIIYNLPVEISVLLSWQCKIESTSFSKDTKL